MHFIQALDSTDVDLQQKEEAFKEQKTVEKLQPFKFDTNSLQTDMISNGQKQGGSLPNKPIKLVQEQQQNKPVTINFLTKRTVDQKDYSDWDSPDDDSVDNKTNLGSVHFGNTDNLSNWDEKSKKQSNKPFKIQLSKATHVPCFGCNKTLDCNIVRCPQHNCGHKFHLDCVEELQEDWDHDAAICPGCNTKMVDFEKENAEKKLPVVQYSSRSQRTGMMKQLYKK